MRAAAALMLALAAAPLPALELAEPLDPELAFVLRARAEGPNGVELRWDIAEGYYLYKDKIRVTALSADHRLGEPELPPGREIEDEFFGRQEVYRGRVSLRVPISRTPAAGSELLLAVQSQGCADLGVCYPVQREERRVRLPNAPGTANLVAAALPDWMRGEPTFLHPDEAYPVSARLDRSGNIVVRWHIVDGYYLYREKMSFRLEGDPAARIGEPVMPRGRMREDEFFGRMEVYEQPVEVTVPLAARGPADAPLSLQIGYQGCAAAGLCYAPITKRIPIPAP